MFFKTRINEEIPIVKVKDFYVLGTINHIMAYGKNGEKAIDKAVERLYEIDNKMSVFKDYSEISKINCSAGKHPEKVSEDTYYVIKKAMEYSALSGGASNPTIRPLVRLWGFGTEHKRIPSADEISKTLRLVNYKDILMDDNYRTVMLINEGQCLDLGAIAKGYAADEVKMILIKNDIKSAIIDLGGNIYALGSKPDGTAWSIGVQNPFTSRGNYIGTLEIRDKSVVTSGNYERFFIKDGKRFHHIIDPNTGYPSENGVISATIISDYSIDGDALSTCAYVMGARKGISLVDSVDGAQAIVITEDKKVHSTSGIKENFKLINNEFSF